MKNFAAILFLLLSANGFAAEADHYTVEYSSVAEVGDEINRIAQTELEKALTSLNQEGNCSTDINGEIRLYEKLQTIFGNHSNGILVKEVLFGETVEKTVIPLKESIYAGWTIFDGMILGRKKAASSPLALSPLIKIKDEVIGVDKLEHLFGMGFIYFKGHYLKNKPLLKVLKNGILKEKTILGGNRLATGVFAYGDLAANFNGMRFWNHVLQKRDDVLGKTHNIGPYVFCKNNQWIINSDKPIDLSKYIDASFDESVNCSKFASKKAIVKFHKIAYEKNRSVQQNNIQCPLKAERLDEINKKYNVPVSENNKDLTIGHWIINNKGHEKVSYLNEF